MAEVDSLEIKLKSNAKDIAADFNALKSSVDGTSQALTGIDGKSFNELAKAVGKFASGKSNTDKLDESLQHIVQSLNRFAQSINQIDTSKFNEITNKLNQIAEIGTKKINEAAKSMQNLDKSASQNSGVKKAKMSYDEFMQSIKGLGSDRTFYGNLQQVNVEIERTRNKIEKINASLEKYNAEGRSVETKGWRSAQAQLEQYTNYLDNLIAKQKELQEASKTDTSNIQNMTLGQTKDDAFQQRLYSLSDDVQRWYSEVSASLTGLGQKAVDEFDGRLRSIIMQPNVDSETMLDQMDSLMLEAHNKFQAEPVRMTPQIDIDEFIAKTEEAAKTVSNNASTRLDFTPTQLKDGQRYSEAYKTLQVEIEKAEKKLEDLYDKQHKYDLLGLDKEKGTYQRLQVDISEADERLQHMYRSMLQLQQSGGDVVNISAFERLSEQTSNAQNTIQLLAKALRGVGLGSAARSVQSISAEMGSLSTGLASTAEAAEGAGAAMAGLQTAIPVIGLVLAAVTMLTKAWIWLAKKAISAIKTIVDGLKSFISKIKEVASSILSIGTSSHKANTLIGKFIQKIVGLVKSRLIRRAITQAFTEIREGFKKLDAYSASIGSQFHPNVQMILADLHLLGRSIAAAFEPVVNAVAPILDFLIQKLVTVINYINQFFSALSGSQTWTRATLTAEDYTTAASGAAKAQKDLNKSIREWDKLNVITDPNKNKSGGGSGSGAPTGTGYVTEDVESPIKNLAEKFKKAWTEGADFTGLGEELGKKLKEELNSINWDGIQETASKLGKAIATAINGFTSVEGLGDSIGKTIAEAINVAIAGFSSFAENIKGDSVGKFIGNIVKSGIEGINWKDYITGMGNLGKQLAEAVNSFVDADSISAISKGLANILKGAIEGAYQFITKVDFGNLGKKIADSINTFFTELGEVDENGMTGFQKAGATLNSLATGLLDTAINAIKDTDWGKIGESIADFLGQINFSEIIKGLVELKDSIKSGLKDLFLNATKDVTWADVISSITSFLLGDNFLSKITGAEIVGTVTSALLSMISAAVQGLFGVTSGISESLAKYFEDLGMDGVAGFFKGISDNLLESAQWVKEKFQIVVDAVKNFFGIHSPSTVFADIGGLLIDGLFEGISKALSSVASWIKENVIDKIIAAFGNAKDWLPDIPAQIKELWGNAKSWLESNTLKIGAELKENIGETIDKLKKKWEKVKFKTKNLTAKVKGGAIDAIKKVKNAWSNLKTGKKNFTVNLKGKALSALEKLKGIWDSLTGKAKDLSVTFNDTVSGRIKDMWNGIANMINKAIEKINKVTGASIGKVPTFDGKKDGGFVGKRYATGGFPEDGWFRASHGEYFGKFDNGQQYIASNRQIENGLMNTVRAGNADVAVLMSQTLEETRRQNALLQQILAKENNISYQDVFKATQKGAKEYKQRVGKPAFT